MHFTTGPCSLLQKINFTLTAVIYIEMLADFQEQQRKMFLFSFLKVPVYAVLLHCTFKTPFFHQNAALLSFSHHIKNSALTNAICSYEPYCYTLYLPVYLITDVFSSMHLSNCPHWFVFYMFCVAFCWDLVALYFSGIPLQNRRARVPTAHCYFKVLVEEGLTSVSVLL